MTISKSHHPNTENHHGHGPLQSKDLEVIYWGENNTKDEVTVSTSATESSQQPLGMDKWGPLPFSGFVNQNQSDAAVFGSSIQNYMESIRSWSSGGSFDNVPPSAPATVTPVPVIAPPLPRMTREDSPPPGMVRSTSGSLSSEVSSEGDETMSAADDDMMVGDSAGPVAPAVKAVSFNEHVRVLPIPPISAYTLNQRFRMYASRFELRENKIRNKREYEFDNYNWKNATEENNMAICPMSGELLHPAHL